MNAYLSKVIYLTRLPLIIGPIFIHAVMNEESMLQMLFHHLGMSSVPILYVISGYLFFGGYSSNRDSLIYKYKSRIKSLLIPYVLWNFIAYLTFSIDGTLSWSQFFTSFWGNAGSNAPADYPLWFIRTLILIMPLIPIIFLFNNKKYICHLSLILAVCWFFQYPVLFSHGTLQGLVLFNLGSYLRLQRIFKKEFIPSKKVALLSMTIWVSMNYLRLMVTDVQFLILLENSSTVFGALFYYGIAQLLPKKQCDLLINNGKASFLTYCQFALSLHFLKMFFVNIGFTNFLGFLVLSFFVLFIGIGVYYLLDRFLPKFCIVLSGSR